MEELTNPSSGDCPPAEENELNKQLDEQTKDLIDNGAVWEEVVPPSNMDTVPTYDPDEKKFCPPDGGGTWVLLAFRKGQINTRTKQPSPDVLMGSRPIGISVANFGTGDPEINPDFQKKMAELIAEQKKASPDQTKIDNLKKKISDMNVFQDALESLLNVRHQGGKTIENWRLVFFPQRCIKIRDADSDRPYNVDKWGESVSLPINIPGRPPVIYGCPPVSNGISR